MIVFLLQQTIALREQVHVSGALIHVTRGGTGKFTFSEMLLLLLLCCCWIDRVLNGSAANSDQASGSGRCHLHRSLQESDAALRCGSC